jgi:hypothetical protein
MNEAFTPSFQHFQKDIERYLKSEGKCERNEHGQTVYRGYQTALSQMFREYIEKDAFEPLVAEFRTWNWAVIAKRRTNYNKTKKAQRALPDRIPEDLVTKTRELLLESLYRLQSYASEVQQESNVREYLEMIARVEKRIKA